MATKTVKQVQATATETAQDNAPVLTPVTATIRAKTQQVGVVRAANVIVHYTEVVSITTFNAIRNGFSHTQHFVDTEKLESAFSQLIASIAVEFTTHNTPILTPVNAAHDIESVKTLIIDVIRMLSQRTKVLKIKNGVDSYDLPVETLKNTFQHYYDLLDVAKYVNVTANQRQQACLFADALAAQHPSIFGFDGYYQAIVKEYAPDQTGADAMKADNSSENTQGEVGRTALPHNAIFKYGFTLLSEGKKQADLRRFLNVGQAQTVAALYDLVKVAPSITNAVNNGKLNHALDASLMRKLKREKANKKTVENYVFEKVNPYADNKTSTDVKPLDKTQIEKVRGMNSFFGLLFNAIESGNVLFFEQLARDNAAELAALFETADVEITEIA